MRLIASIALVIGSLALIGGLVAYSGLYSVAASESHAPVVEKLLKGAMRRSVGRHASAISVPDLTQEGRLSEGLRHYGEMCETCHGAPGGSPTGVARGLYPKPPRFAEETLDWTNAELFWITKHGIKMTGMPGFGATHEDEEVWSIVAAVRQLSKLDASTYRAATDSPLAEEGSPGHSGHPH